eukprot:846662_1
MSPGEGYKRLIERMGIFRWQSSHGFRTGQNRGLIHLKPKFDNPKEEALGNSYCALSTEHWNQPLRKSKIFYQSWGRRRIRARSAGNYRDEVSDMHFSWDDPDDCIRLREVITLKLYTDFDKLQYELKKCFRWETMNDFIDVLRTDEDVKRDEYKRKELE